VGRAAWPLTGARRRATLGRMSPGCVVATGARAFAAAAMLVVATAAGAEPARHDILHYRLALAPELATGELRSEVELRVRVTPGAGPLVLTLADAWRIEEARVAGRVAEARRGPDRVELQLPERAGEVAVSFRMSGAPGKSFDEDRAAVTADGLFLLWSDAFYPIAYDDWATVRTELVLPDGFEAIAPGRPLARERAGERVRHVFEARTPTVCFSVFADRRWIRREHHVAGERVVTLLHPESDRHAARIAAGSADVLRFFTDLHGVRGSEAFAFVTLEGIHARRAFNGFVGYSPAYLEKELARTGYDAHETSLLWWGYVTNGRGPGAFQWNEGLGDYVEVLYGEARGKPLPESFRRHRAEYLAALATAPEAEPTRSELRGNTPQKWVHGKYPWLMGVLREGIGDRAFRRGLRLLFERHRYRTYTIEALVGAMEEAAGRPVAWWRDGWLERRGVPAVEVAWRAVRGPAGWRAEGTLRAEAGLAEVPIEVAARSARGETRKVIRGATGETPFALELADEPLEVVIDPRERLLVRKAVHGPTEPRRGPRRRAQRLARLSRRKAATPSATAAAIRSW
jgi:hypothetical protein